MSSHSLGKLGRKGHSVPEIGAGMRLNEAQRCMASLGNYSCL